MIELMKNKLRSFLKNLQFDLVYDSLAFCSNDVIRLLEHVKCKKYIVISSAAVYNKLHLDTKEEDFAAENTKLLTVKEMIFLIVNPSNK